MPAKLNLIGQRFGRLIVTAETESRKEMSGKTRRRCMCRCDCGNNIVVSNESLLSENTRSCGCFKTEGLITRSLIHGHSSNGKWTRTYVSWAGMMARCHNPHCEKFIFYGARGITVCEHWHLFENFLADMGECPHGLTLERLDNNKGYSKENCAWKNRKVQARNRRSNLVFTINGTTACLMELCEKFGMKYDVVRQRVVTLKWGINRAMFTPTK